MKIGFIGLGIMGRGLAAVAYPASHPCDAREQLSHKNLPNPAAPAHVGPIAVEGLNRPLVAGMTAFSVLLHAG
jgi:hypothetical protein